MESNLNISIDTGSLRHHMNVVIPARLNKLSPSFSMVPPMIKTLVHNDLEATFNSKGSNIGFVWKDLADETKLARRKAGLPEGPPLLRSGNIHASIGPSDYGWSLSYGRTFKMKLRRGAHAGSSHPFKKSNANLLMVHTLGGGKLPARQLFDIKGFGVSGRTAKKIRSLVRQHVWQVCQGSI